MTCTSTLKYTKISRKFLLWCSIIWWSFTEHTHKNTYTTQWRLCQKITTIISFHKSFVLVTIVIGALTQRSWHRCRWDVWFIFKSHIQFQTSLQPHRYSWINFTGQIVCVRIKLSTKIYYCCHLLRIKNIQNGYELLLELYTDQSWIYQLKNTKFAAFWKWKGRHLQKKQIFKFK